MRRKTPVSPRGKAGQRYFALPEVFLGRGKLYGHFVKSLFEPAAPLIDVKVVNRLTGNQESTPGLLDTGADISFVPNELVERLGLVQRDFERTQDFGGTNHDIPIYFVNLRLEQFSVERIKVGRTELPFFIVGRDILNHFVVLLDAQSDLVRLERQ